MSSSNDPPNNLEVREKLYQARQEFEQRQALRSFTDHQDEAWVRWEYSPNEWALFEKIDWRFQRLLFWVPVGSLVLIVLAAILPWFVWNSETDPGLVFGVFVPASFLWVVSLILLGLYNNTYQDARARHKARQKLPHTATFSKRGVWEASTFFPFNEGSVTLKRVTMTSQPPVLHFRLAGSFVPLRVLIPRGQEGEASLLLERFQTEVISVREKEEERQKQEAAQRLKPPEPREEAKSVSEQPAQGITDAVGMQEGRVASLELELVDATDFKNTVSGLEARIATLEKQYTTTLGQLTDALLAIKELQDR